MSMINSRITSVALSDLAAGVLRNVNFFFGNFIQAASPRT